MLSSAAHRPRHSQRAWTHPESLALHSASEAVPKASWPVATRYCCVRPALVQGWGPTQVWDEYVDSDNRGAYYRTAPWFLLCRCAVRCGRQRTCQGCRSHAGSHCHADRTSGHQTVGADDLACGFHPVALCVLHPIHEHGSMHGKKYTLERKQYLELLQKILLDGV